MIIVNCKIIHLISKNLYSKFMCYYFILIMFNRINDNKTCIDITKL